jgi:hypothetical protein
VEVKDVTGIDLFSIPDEWQEIKKPLGALIKAEEEFRSGVIDLGKYEVLRKKCIEDIEEIINKKTKTYSKFVSSYLAKISI